MSDAPKAIHPRAGTCRPHHARSWRREAVEVAALFLAVGLAHLLATLLGHTDPGPVVLVGLGAALVVGSAVHKRLHGGPPSGAGRRGAKGSRAGRRGAKGSGAPLPEGGAGTVMSLWRIRMRVVERPGRLAEVAGAFGRLGCNILSLHIAPTGSSAITPAGCDALDEFVVEAPTGLEPDALRAALAAAGGLDVFVVPARVKDLTDPGVQGLLLARRVHDDPGQLPQAMGELLRAPEVEWRRPGETVAEEAELNSTMVVSVHPERALLLRRPGLPFTPTEAARAAALAAAARDARYSRT
ncbi:ACT domain-containing protein [Nonomuraea sp. SMC257]|uniref:ACT domain-containing protein n=1 Tax=Nonomuraea montanisoli TaxID=2741721 RepID=A0A7Y6M3H7_9ACTN|nr:ACT domain-containing protein [Nonomuraea montanisoli]NUW32465.1 ACT domain-containing protein [Nonomuraea montanisoli]